MFYVKLCSRTVCQLITELSFSYSEWVRLSHLWRKRGMQDHQMPLSCSIWFNQQSCLHIKYLWGAWFIIDSPWNFMPWNFREISVKFHRSKWRPSENTAMLKFKHMPAELKECGNKCEHAKVWNCALETKLSKKPSKSEPYVGDEP